MAGGKTLPEVYADVMKIHGKGHGFYEPEEARDVRPGVCGYVNKSGQWRPIVDMTDKDALAKGRYKPIGQLVKARSSEFVWEDIKSEGVHRQKPSFAASVDGTAAGVPAEGSITFSVESTVSSGAVLLCNSSVHRKGFADETILREWGKANASAILRNCKDAKEQGFWIVMTTWATSDTWTNAWSESKKEVSIGFKVKAVGAGELAPSMEYSNTNSGGGWIHPIPTVRNGEVEKRVIFFVGIQFKLFALPFGAHAHEVRGSEGSFVITDPDDEQKPEEQQMRYEVEWTVEGNIEEDEEEAVEEEDE